MSNSKKIWRILAFLVICIPLYLAVYSIYTISSDNLNVDNVTRVTVVRSDGVTFEYISAADRRMFIAAVDRAREVSAVPFSLEQPKILTFHRGERLIVYELFLTLDPAQCVLRSGERLFRIDTADARRLLNLPISHTLFRHSHVPAATVAQGDRTVRVYPEADGVWRLRKLDGEFHDTSVAGITSEAAGSNEARISQNQPFTIYFDVEPDNVTVDVLQVHDRREIFLGPLEQMHLHFDGRTELQFVLTAEWREHADADFYGRAVYNINVVYEVPAWFAVSALQAEHGDLLIITAFNVGEREEMTLSVPELGYTAGFMQYGEYRIALLPVGTDFTGVLNALVEGAHTENYQIVINPPAPVTRNFGATEETINAHLSAAARNDRLSRYNEIFAIPSETQKLWEGSFVNPSPRAVEVLIEYGANVTTNRGNAYINRGVNLAADTDSPVFASNAGRVIFTGMLTKYGNLIVIDHGAGLRTWYGRLDTIGVQVGDMVEAGQQIGVFGRRTGIQTSLAPNLYFAVSVHDIFINPLNLLRDGIRPAVRSGAYPEPPPIYGTAF